MVENIARGENVPLVVAGYIEKTILEVYSMLMKPYIVKLPVLNNNFTKNISQENQFKI